MVDRLSQDGRLSLLSILVNSSIDPVVVIRFSHLFLSVSTRFSPHLINRSIEWYYLLTT